MTYYQLINEVVKKSLVGCTQQKFCSAWILREIEEYARPGRLGESLPILGTRQGPRRGEQGDQE